MKALALLAVTVVGLGGLYMIAYAAWRGFRSYKAGDLYPSQKVMRDHQALVRLVDRWMCDEMIRPLIPEAEQSKASDLLARYYEGNPR